MPTCALPPILLLLLSCKGCGTNLTILVDQSGLIFSLRKPFSFSFFLSSAVAVFAYFRVSKGNEVVFAGILYV